VFQIKSFNLKSNHQNGSNRDLNPNRDWDLPITGPYYALSVGMTQQFLFFFVPGDLDL